ncbi:hypothetical protein BC937DRAFT_87740, partial [Endogone sp. FLAS-F59071]
MALTRSPFSRPPGRCSLLSPFLFQYTTHNSYIRSATIGIFNNSAFTMVMSDMNGNIEKVNKRYLVNPSGNDTLQNLVAGEQGEKKRTASEGLLWLN